METPLEENHFRERYGVGGSERMILCVVRIDQLTARAGWQTNLANW